MAVFFLQGAINTEYESMLAAISKCDKLLTEVIGELIYLAVFGLLFYQAEQKGL
ncbi:hypothetical protein HMPREF9372_0962 [Sporosarcina newyorkensis 2681]|uniref:Uncharacterized protein n=1 Tax=Sporosarcina newyorkensis 2681 TaxID=1027292 RepID=F9DQ82_9BACL|nr:hypothetical protein [Sporosarcina newyorkensis]EGQ27040.1 hypothetical protein HMPREF9372_0962 [Sporosarcina newyorkensis 2681]